MHKICLICTICKIYAKCINEKCKIHAKKSAKYMQNMQKICKICAKWICKIYARYVQDVCKIWAQHAKKYAEYAKKYAKYVQNTHVTPARGRVQRLWLWGQLGGMLAVNGTELSDNLVFKWCNFEFVILHNPLQECSRTMVCSASSGSLPPLNRVLDSPRNPLSQHLQNLKYWTWAVQRTQTQPLHSRLLLNPILHLRRGKVVRNDEESMRARKQHSRWRYWLKQWATRLRRHIRLVRLWSWPTLW